MKILNHKLSAQPGDPTVVHKNTPNQTAGVTIQPRYLIIHYTAGASYSSSVDWLMNPRSQASAHLVIGRKGEIAQLGAFNRRLWHAGVSQWAGLTGLNSHSIGIELDNVGRLTKRGDKYTHPDNERVVVDPSDVIFATHKNENRESAWQAYTQKQLSTLFDIASLLVKHYDLTDILGHDDISPGRKADPGPAFPMDKLVAYAYGRKDDTDNYYKVSVNAANFRSSPEIRTDNIIGSLKRDTVLEYITTQNGWFQVYVVTDVTNIPERIGWVHNTVVKLEQG